MQNFKPFGLFRCNVGPKWITFECNNTTFSVWSLTIHCSTSYTFKMNIYCLVCYVCLPSQIRNIVYWTFTLGWVDCRQLSSQIISGFQDTSIDIHFTLNCHISLFFLFRDSFDNLSVTGLSHKNFCQHLKMYASFFIILQFSYWNFLSKNWERLQRFNIPALIFNILWFVNKSNVCDQSYWPSWPTMSGCSTGVLLLQLVFSGMDDFYYWCWCCWW